MIHFLEQFQDTVAKFPDRVAVVDRDGERTTSYKELYDQAARINHWLKNHGIGTESVVAIYFPKGVEYIATRIGVIMAGAAWVGLEDMMGSSRMEYVSKDCGCAAVFDKNLWDEAMELDSSYDFADPDDHDLAFFIYTSGSTGEPKGAANEYGIYDYIMTGVNGFVGPYAFPEGRKGEPKPVQFAHVLPETFVGGVYITVGILDAQSTIHVISPEMTRDVKRLVQYFIEHRIDTTFMTPTFLNLLQTVPGLAMRAAFTGGEIVSGVFCDKFDIINVYGPSEFGYPSCLFKLDKAYEITPIGYPVADTDFRLIDEEGKESDEGELIVHLPWSRGYHHLPQENKRAEFFLQEKKYFRTSDIAKRDRNGCITILGRADDMVKINGNRVDPSETEKAMKEAFDLDFCVVKPIRQGERDVLCAWYTKATVPEPEEAAVILKTHLPYYMIPSHFVHIDEIPLKANGKVDRMALPEPVLEREDRAVSAPETDMERLLCGLWQKILVVKRPLGVDEDFFELGGDSIHAMQIITEADLPGMTISILYEGRTVRRICSLYEEWAKAKKDGKSEDVTQLQAPLNIGQKYLLEYDRKYPDTTMLNIPIRFNFRYSVDLYKLSEAIKTCFRAHPALLSTIEPTADGEYRQRYVKEFDTAIQVETVTDEELEKIAKSFVRPFKPDGSPMMRCRILEGENKKSILFDVSHLICDGWSLDRIFRDIDNILKGKDPSEDYCFALLREEASSKDSLAWKKDMAYFRDRYDKGNYATLPIPDHFTDENESAFLIRPFDFDKKAAESVLKKHHLGKNGLYLLASAMAIAEYNEASDILISWTWNGRADAHANSSVGVFFKDLPVVFHIEKEADILSLLKETKIQIEEGIAHGRASYFMETGDYKNSDLLCFLYQGDLYQYDPNDIVESVSVMDKGIHASNNALNVEILDSKDDFGVLLGYNGAMYDKASMERFAEIICNKCNEIITACC